MNFSILTVISNEQDWTDSGQTRMGYWINLGEQWSNLNAQLTILNLWWKNRMDMSGQIWVDSGRQEHSNLDQSGKCNQV